MSSPVYLVENSIYNIRIHDLNPKRKNITELWNESEKKIFKKTFRNVDFLFHINNNHTLYAFYRKFLWHNVFQKRFYSD